MQHSFNIIFNVGNLFHLRNKELQNSTELLFLMIPSTKQKTPLVIKRRFFNLQRYITSSRFYMYGVHH